MSFLPIRKVVMAAAFFCAGLICDAVVSQENSQAESDVQTQPTAFDEEVVVRGRSRTLLRAEIRIAEEALYERFNEINSDDEFDIFCRFEPVTGSRVLRRLCQANFWREADANIGEETARALQGGISVNVQQFRGEQHFKTLLMTEEMRQLATEDEAFLASLIRLANLQDLLTEGKRQSRSSASSARYLTAGDGALPYGAELVVEVRLGRDPWRHTLILRTFTIAQVNEKIRSIEVECDRRAERLEYEAEAEWTLPASWGSCTLIIDAKRDTTFSLYEFE